MSFQPYSIYATRLPVLEVGYLVEAAAKMWQVSVARRLRISIPLVPGSADVALQESTAHPEYATLTGNLEVARITNLQYIAFGTANDVLLKWMMEPLGSKFHNVLANNVLFPLTNPWEVKRWSYNKEQHLKYTLGAGLAQTLYFENMEYLMDEYKKALTAGQEYLKLLADGQARMVRKA